MLLQKKVFSEGDDGENIFLISNQGPNESLANSFYVNLVQSKVFNRKNKNMSIKKKSSSREEIKYNYEI